MADFNDAIAMIKLAEGTGSSNTPGDLGGFTRFGISSRAYPNLDLKNMTDEQLLDIYKRDYWDAHNLDAVKSQMIANQFCVLVINMEPHEAVEVLQHAVNLWASRELIDEDGLFGKETLGLVNSMIPNVFSAFLRVASIQHYMHRIDALPTQEKFLHSWIRRCLL